MTSKQVPLFPIEILQRMAEISARQLIAAAEHELRRAQALHPATLAKKPKPKMTAIRPRTGQHL